MEMRHIKEMFFFILCILNYSCTVNKISVAENTYYYDNKIFNKKLEISGTFLGDMKFQNLSKKNLIYIHKVIQSNLILKNKTLISYSKTTVEPNYETILFYDDKNTSSTEGLIVNDSMNGFVIYKKNNKNKAVLLLLKSSPNKKAYNNSTIIADGKTIIGTVTFDNNELNNTTYNNVFNGVKELENYLIARDKLKITLQQSNDEKFNQFQFLITINSFISNNEEYDSLIAIREQKIQERNQPFVDSLLINYDTNKSTIDKIIELVKSKKVMMLNENHWYPKHRVLAFQLLDKLKDNGFNYVAVEALDAQKDSILNLNQFPSKKTGYYTREPYFAHFLRKAKKLGFQIVAYDDVAINNRELAQATNLKKLLDNDPKAKLFVYAGIDHILESNPAKKRMAEYFKEISGINPITFNQDKLIANTKMDLVIFPSSNLKNIPKLNTNVDYFIINNLKPSLNEILKNTNFKKYVLKIDNPKKYLNENVLIKIYAIDEYTSLRSNAIPISIFTQKIINNKIEFEFPNGKYYIKIWSNSDDLIFNKLIY
jgi:hypothetical protein